MKNQNVFIIVLVIILIIMSWNKNKELFINEKDIYTIKNIKPEISVNINSPIVFVYVYTPNIFPYCQHSIINLLSYA